MTLHQLAVFCEIVRTASFGRAADNLHISRPAISAQIKALEEELGHPLFARHRGTKGVELTGAGKLVYQVATKVLNSLEQLTTDLRYLHAVGEAGGRTITVASNTTIGIYLLPKLLSEFQARFPSLSVRVIVETDAATMMTAFRQHRYDVAVFPTQVAVPDVIQDFVFTQALTVVANPALADSDPFLSPHWEQLPLVLPIENTFVRRVIDAYFDGLGVRPKVLLEASHPEAVKATAKTSKVAAVTHRIAVEEDIRHGHLVELRPPVDLPLLAYQVVRPRSRQSEEGRLLSMFLQEEIGRETTQER